MGGGVKMGWMELQLGYFWALRARVVSTAVWFVADMLEVTVGVAAGPAVEVVTDGCLLWVLVAGWEGIVGGCAKGVGEGVVVEDEKGRKGWTGFDRVGQPKVR